MSSTNLVVLLGRLTADPELKYTNSGTPVCNLRMATDRYGKEKGTDYHNIVVWGSVEGGGPAEAAANILRKGWLVQVIGRLTYRKWEAQGGTRVVAEVIASNVQFLRAPKGTEGGEEQEWQQSEDQAVSSVS